MNGRLNIYLIKNKLDNKIDGNFSTCIICAPHK